MDDIFGGTLQSTLQCQACGWKSHCFDPFMGLAVPIPPAPSKARTVSVQDCLKVCVWGRAVRERGYTHGVEGGKNMFTHTVCSSRWGATCGGACIMGALRLLQAIDVTLHWRHCLDTSAILLLMSCEPLGACNSHNLVHTPTVIHLCDLPAHCCLRQAFVEVEKLDGSESYKCESCKKCCPHTKRLQVWRPPRVLILTLKRFAARNAGGSIFARFRYGRGWQAAERGVGVWCVEWAWAVDSRICAPNSRPAAVDPGHDDILVLAALQPPHPSLMITHLMLARRPPPGPPPKIARLWGWTGPWTWRPTATHLG